MNITELPVKVDAGKVQTFCRHRQIRRLSLFGSVLREDFDPARSDVDVLVEFSPGHEPGWEFFRYGEDLSRLLGIRADCHTPAMISPLFRDEVMRESMVLYEQA